MKMKILSDDYETLLYHFESITSWDNDRPDDTVASINLKEKKMKCE